MKFVQGVLPFRIHGGRRRGAGRKREAELSQVPHRARARHNERHPVHVTLRTRSRSLRSQFVFPTLRRAIAAANRRRPDAFRVVEYSVQSNHIHLIVEATSAEELSSGMRSLNIRVARNVNRLLFQRGPFFADRWHGRELSSPRAVRNALVYVLANHAKHTGDSSGVDLCSSAPYFAYFKERLPDSTIPAPSNARPRTWLLAKGWLAQGGAISVFERPKAAMAR